MEGKAKAACELGNTLLRMSMEGCLAAHAAGAFWFFEHPEDLGRTAFGDMPASVFQLPELQSMAADCGAFCSALHQYHFRATSSKPTRLLTTLPAARHMP